MKININHPTFILFLDNTTINILSRINVNDYFSQTKDKKIKTQYIVFKLIKNTIKNDSDIYEDNIKTFISILCKKNEESENYEFASILNDIFKNFDNINEMSKSLTELIKPLSVPKQTNIK